MPRLNINRAHVEELAEKGGGVAAALAQDLLTQQNDSSVAAWIFTESLAPIDGVSAFAGGLVMVAKGNDLLAAHVHEGFAGPVGQFIGVATGGALAVAAERAVEGYVAGPYLGVGRRSFMKDVRLARREAKASEAPAARKASKAK